MWIVYSVESAAFVWQSTGAFHGSRISMDSFSCRFGAFVKTHLRYSYGSRSFSLAVSMMLKAVALAFAPDGVLANSQFFLPITKGLMLLSDYSAPITAPIRSKENINSLQ